MEWDLLLQVESEFESDMISKNLEFQGVATKVFSARVFTLTLGSDTRNIVRVFVRKGDISRAHQILQSLDIVDVGRQQNLS